MALFVLAFALDSADAPRAAADEQRAAAALARGCRDLPAARRRRGVHLQPARPRLVRDRGAALARSSRRCAGRSPVDWSAVRAGIAAHRVTIGVAALIVIAVAAIAFVPAKRFRLQDRRRPGVRRAPELARLPGRGVLDLARRRLPHRPRRGRPARLLAVAIGFLAAAYGAWVLIRDRRLALLAMLVTGGVVYVGARLFAEIHVRGEGADRDRAARPAGRPPRPARRRRVSRFATRPASSSWSPRPPRRCSPCATPRSASTSASSGSSDSPTSPTARRSPSSASTASPATTCAARSPAPPPATCPRRSPRARRSPGSRARRPTSTASTPGQLDKFDYAITTAAAYQSTRAAELGAGRRGGRLRAVGARGRDPAQQGPRRRGRQPPGATLPCCGERPEAPARRGRCRCERRRSPSYTDWKTPAPPDATRRRPGARLAGAGRGDDRARPAQPGPLRALAAVPLAGAAEVVFDGEVVAELPASLEGMYLSGAGRGAFWPAGEIDRRVGRMPRSTVRAAEPNGLADALGARRLVWLGDLAAAPRRRRRGRRARRRVRPLRRPLRLRQEGRRGLMPHFGTPDEAPSPVVGGDGDRARRRDREAGLHRRHRAQRHPRALAARSRATTATRWSRSRCASTPTPTAFPACSRAR